ncbi:hypothetical protein SAMN05216413_2364 [Ruminococcaceae bacterium KH2T8]|nr:hypothetical protein SAMN05216413_2364 [Ruminococcaceae bacterium KH2T8]
MGEEKTSKVIIVGAGAAGLFAGCFLKKEGIPFVILERGDKPGRKLLLTGHGRCNITNNKSPKILKEGYHEAGSYIYSAIKSFAPEDAMKFIRDELGVELKEEDNNRIFPVSDSAETIRSALVDHIGRENIITGFCCVSVDKNDDLYTVISDKGERISAPKVILACGGRSFPETGSDGLGYKVASGMGHTVTPLIPALTSVDVCADDREFTSAVSGVSVNAGASLYCDTKKKASGMGSVLFTHKGISGPVIQELSREIPRNISSSDGWIELDFTPHRTDAELDRELLEEINSHPDSKITTLASKYVPSSVADKLGERAGVTDLRAGMVTRDGRRELLKGLKHLELHIDNPPAYETAYVTRGGVALKEIKRESMESKIMPGVYVIGEMLDIDGVSGGYNLQACMSEAFIAVRDIMG